MRWWGVGPSALSVRLRRRSIQSSTPDPSEQSSQPGKTTCLTAWTWSQSRPAARQFMTRSRTERNGTERLLCRAWRAGRGQTDRSSRHLTWEQSRESGPSRARTPRPAGSHHVASHRICSFQDAGDERARPTRSNREKIAYKRPRPVTTACAGGNPVAAGGHVRHRRRTRVAPAGLPTCCGVAVPTCRATVILFGETEKPCRDDGSSCTHQVRSKSWAGFRLPAHHR